MFDEAAPRLFALPPGVDFPMALVQGIRQRMENAPPEAIARVEVFLNSGRMRRAVQEAFVASGAAFLPRLRLITDLGADPILADLPPALSPLRRRLELAQLVGRLLDAQPDLAPRAATYDLADSLALLMDEMGGEGVSPDALASLDVGNHSAHWRRSLDFLEIVSPFFSGAAAPDAEARQRIAVDRLADLWLNDPPPHPVIVAGSTGSRGTTAKFMQAVARLPQGALVLPGFDFDLPSQAWDAMNDALTAEDHPQFRFRRLMDALSIGPAQIRRWLPQPPADPARNKLISLSLRPAPTTDQWLSEGRLLPDLQSATSRMSLVEAASPRLEALAVALALRKAAEDGRSAALISPDRLLTRRVITALDRWHILPDDSAGKPLALSAPGRFLRHVAGLMGQKLTSEALLVLLKHPITSTGSGRGNHLLWTRDLELHLRRNGPVFPTGPDLLIWAANHRQTEVLGWANWLAAILDDASTVAAQTLADHVRVHLELAGSLASGPAGLGSGELWEKAAGASALEVCDQLRREAPHGGHLGVADYRDLFDAVLNSGEVREPVFGHPLIQILGPREARECWADLVILGGLNDGIWPRMPAPDPWLNRQMRQAAGLLLPERQIGLSAHDFQQAVTANEVILTRSARDAEAETVPSRWVNRLLTLLGGLPDQNGPEALANMRARGSYWMRLAQEIEKPAGRAALSSRPAPRPPVGTRPKELPVTAISKLIRDPYFIYARYILRLRPLDALRHSPDAMSRGSVVHLILDEFIRDRPEETRAEARARLHSVADGVLATHVPWPTARLLWRARLDRVADAFLAREDAGEGIPVLIETPGAAELGSLGFRLTAKPDRIDELPDGRLHILDYKTGSPPTERMQAAFDKQLLLEAAMAARGAFKTLGPRDVARISYIGLNAAAKVVSTELTLETLDATWDDLHKLISRYQSPSQGYASRRAVFEDRFAGDYDHLARYGEWEMSDRPQPEDVE